MSSILGLLWSQEKRGLFWWTFSLLLLTLVVLLTYPITNSSGEEFDAIWEQYQDQFGDLFGSCGTITDYPCYMETQILNLLPVILGIYATSLASRLVAGARQSGQLDILLSFPIGRSKVWWSHIVILVGTQFLIATLIGIVIAIGAAQYGVDRPWLRGVLSGWNILPATLSFGLFAYLLSIHVKSRGAVAGVGAGIVLASYFIGGLAPLSSTTEDLKWLSLTYLYLQGQPLRMPLYDTYFYASSFLISMLLFWSWLNFRSKSFQ